MSLFDGVSFWMPPTEKNNPIVAGYESQTAAVEGRRIAQIAPLLEAMDEGKSVYFMTDGAWSNIDIVQKLLKICGPCSINFCTWSISIDAIRKFAAWQQKGLITSLHVLLDQGIRNRKPEIFQQASHTFKNLRILKCHAKVTVIKNERYSFTIVGSANFTNNPRKEAGIIIRDAAIADINIQWIRKEFQDA